MKLLKFDNHFLLIAITFLYACNGFLVETNIIQTIAASMGGTILQYQIGTGLFIFSLGLGSLLYLILAPRIHFLKLLFFSVFTLNLLAIVGPFSIYYLGETLQWTFLSPMAWLVYLPVLLVGLVTGLDLPVLIFLAQDSKTHTEEKIMGYDYLGMVVGCLTFPFLFSQLGIFELIYVCLGLGLLTLIFLGVLKVRPTPPKPIPWGTPSRKTLMLICFLLAFCSLCYELLLARWLVDFFENEVFAMTFAIGFYLAGLAFGALTVKKENPEYQLIQVETLLIISVLLVPMAGYILATLWTTHLRDPLSLWIMRGLFLTLIAWIGFLSGRELPLLMKTAYQDESKIWPFLFFWNYLGALIASLFVTFFALPFFTLFGGLIFVVGINLLTFGILIFEFQWPKQKVLVNLLAMTLVILASPRLTTLWEQIFLKVTYNKITAHHLNFETFKDLFIVNRELSDIRRIVTPYQNIDLVRNEIPDAGTGIDDLHLYLNQQPQFSLFYHDLYHDSFSWGALSLAINNPKKVLILGGGDGLLANKLRKISNIQDITLIELDHKMIQLASEHWRIQKANDHVFDQNVVNLVIQDAFSWLKENREQFDGIFVDFPYPNNYELNRLYSKQFYSLVYDHLTEDGFLIFNAPLSFQFESKDSELFGPTQVLLNTIDKAGFHSVLAFGTKEPFIYAEKKKRLLEFNYSKLPLDFPNSSFVNLAPIKEVMELTKADEVNDLYRPQKVVSW